MAKRPRVGDPAPAFRVEQASGGSLSSDDLRGKPYVMFFFPKAATPG